MATQYIGSTPLRAHFRGGTAIGRAYRGAALVWQAAGTAASIVVTREPSLAAPVEGQAVDDVLDFGAAERSDDGTPITPTVTAEIDGTPIGLSDPLPAGVDLTVRLRWASTGLTGVLRDLAARTTSGGVASGGPLALSFGEHTAAGAGRTAPFIPGFTPTSLTIDAGNVGGAYQVVGAGTTRVGVAPSAGGSAVAATLTLTLSDGTRSETVTVPVEVAPGEHSAASYAEAKAALNAMPLAGGRTVRLRAGEHATPSLLSDSLTTRKYTSRVVLTGEPGARFRGGVQIKGAARFSLRGIEVHNPNLGDLPAVVKLSSSWDECAIEDCDIHGVPYDIAGDYSAGGPKNVDGIASGGFGQGLLTVRRNRIHDVHEGYVVKFSDGGQVVEDNEVYRTYSDTMKSSCIAGALTGEKTVRRNVLHQFVGNPRNADNPHIDSWQFVSNANNDGLNQERFTYEQNVGWETDACQGESVQGVVTFNDVGGAANVLLNPVIRGNSFHYSGNHPLTFARARSGVIENNTFTQPSENYRKTGTSDIEFTNLAGAPATIVRENVAEDPESKPNGSVSFSGNLTLDAAARPSSYSAEFGAGGRPPRTWEEWKRAFVSTSGKGAHRNGYTYGAPRDPRGWSSFTGSHTPEGLGAHGGLTFVPTRYETEFDHTSAVVRMCMIHGGGERIAHVTEAGAVHAYRTGDTITDNGDGSYTWASGAGPVELRVERGNLRLVGAAAGAAVAATHGPAAAFNVTPSSYPLILETEDGTEIARLTDATTHTTSGAWTLTTLTPGFYRLEEPTVVRPSGDVLLRIKSGTANVEPVSATGGGEPDLGTGAAASSLIGQPLPDAG